MTIRRVRLAELVEDWDIYPRHNYDSAYVSSLRDAIAVGDALPPPVVTSSGMRIVDGWHRVRAWRHHLGSGGEIDCDVRRYPTEADVVRDAVRLNASHGRKLDAQDRARSALLLERHGVVVDEIKVILSMPAEKVRLITASPGRIVIVKDEKVPAKPSARMRGLTAPRVLTPDQAAAHRSSQGVTVVQAARDLIRRIESGLFTAESDPGGAEELWRLHDVIETRLPRV